MPSLRQSTTHRLRALADLQFMLSHALDQVELTGENLQIGDKVKVIKGNLKGLTGELMEGNKDYQSLLSGKLALQTM